MVVPEGWETRVVAQEPSRLLRLLRRPLVDAHPVARIPPADLGVDERPLRQRHPYRHRARLRRLPGHERAAVPVDEDPDPFVFATYRLRADGTYTYPGTPPAPTTCSRTPATRRARDCAARGGFGRHARLHDGHRRRSSSPRARSRARSSPPTARRASGRRCARGRAAPTRPTTSAPSAACRDAGEAQGQAGGLAGRGPTRSAITASPPCRRASTR